MRLSSQRRRPQHRTDPAARSRPLVGTADTPPVQSLDTRTGHLSSPSEIRARLPSGTPVSLALDLSCSQNLDTHCQPMSGPLSRDLPREH